MDTVNYEYDSMYRLAKATAWDGETIEYGYDELGNITEVKKVSGAADQEIETYIMYGGTSPHAGMNRLEAIWYDMNGDGDTVDSGDYVVDLGYDGNGNMIERDVSYPYGGGTDADWDYVYDEDDRMVRSVETVSGSSTATAYAYDPLQLIMPFSPF